jgi:hypothetical protein
MLIYYLKTEINFIESLFFFLMKINHYFLIMIIIKINFITFKKQYKFRDTISYIQILSLIYEYP